MIELLRRIANSPQLLVMVFVVTMLSASLLYMVAEDTGFLNAVYWSIVTATTLGYGDFSPHSSSGKVLTSFLITFTVFVLLPTITANVAAWLIVNRDVFTHEEQEQLKNDLREVLGILKGRDSN